MPASTLQNPAGAANSAPQTMIFVASLADLAASGQIVVRGADRPIVCFYNGGEVRAVDNRCPHLGFPLAKGSCEDGVITCPWHNARFEADSGCTFDLFAGDVEPFDVEIRGEEVYVSSYPRQRDRLADAWRRLREGMETNNGLVAAKAILNLLDFKVTTAEIVREAALFGVARRDGWGPGLTSLTALANLDEFAGERIRFLALYQGVRRVAQDCQGQSPRQSRYALETSRLAPETLLDWMQQWTKVRHRTGVERTLLTAVENRLPQDTLVSLVFEPAMQRVYADGSHLLDFANKAFELLDLIGWEHAGAVLPSLMAQMAGARGGEEQNAWRQPVDLIPLLGEASADLAELFAAGTGKNWDGTTGLAETICAASPRELLAACRDAIAAGATPVQLAQSVAYAAALRMARFGAANEIGDWFTALHTFSYCHAMHRVLQRSPRVELVPGVLHGALSIYLDRFLNVPPARLPARRDDLPVEPEAILEQFLVALDQRNQDERAARLAAHYLELGYEFPALVDTFLHAVVREDADFHLIQMIEAATREYLAWPNGPERNVFFVAAARYFAASFPTQRTQQQTALIAWRLHRGEKLYE